MRKGHKDWFYAAFFDVMAIIGTVSAALFVMYLILLAVSKAGL